MKLLKTAYLTIASSSVIAIAPVAFANSGAISQASVANGATAENIFINQTNRSNGSNGHVPVYLLGSSETATRFYKTGVKHFEKGSLEKSEAAFQAVLRAHGSNSMDKLTLHYLTLINDKQGDPVAKEKYAQAYFDLD